MKRATTILLFCLLSCLSFGQVDPQHSQLKKLDEITNSPRETGIKVVTDLLNRTDFMYYHSGFLNTLHYAEACAGTGAMQFACQLNDTLLIKKITQRYQNLIAHIDTLPANHVDASVIGILPLSFYLCLGGNDYLKEGIFFANKQWDNPLPNGLTNQTRYWIDDIFMIGSLQMRAYRATGNKIYLERAANEIDAYINRLQQPNGLFYHGENAPFYWGRGNGWVACGLAEIIPFLPESDEHYKSIMTGYKKMMEALLKYQTTGGMWRQLIDQEDSWEESSATAMFGYAIKTGIDSGILKDQEYVSAYQKAWNSIVKHIDTNGKLTGICAGMGQSTDKQYYLDRPQITGDLHGQAPLLWFATSLLDHTIK